MDKRTWEEVGAEIARKRSSIRPRLSQPKLSQRLADRGVKVLQQTISNIENGIPIQWDSLVAICDELGLEVQLSVRDGAEQQRTYEGPPEVVEAARILNGLPPDERQALLTLLQLFPHMTEKRRGNVLEMIEFWREKHEEPEAGPSLKGNTAKP